jgi:hypothetical protein
MSPYLIRKMINPFFTKMWTLRKNKIIICFNSHINAHMTNIIDRIDKQKHLVVIQIKFSKMIAHHSGQRKKKMKRL